VLVCGGRNYWDGNRVWRVLNAAVDRLGLSVVIQGGATGADNLAWQWARDHGVPFETYAADWHAQGNAAGPIRNQRMIDEGRPDVVIAFPGGRGTADMVRRAEAAGIKVVRITA
jgi:hypothetical protein